MDDQFVEDYRHGELCCCVLVGLVGLSKFLNPSPVSQTESRFTPARIQILDFAGASRDVDSAVRSEGEPPVSPKDKDWEGNNDLSSMDFTALTRRVTCAVTGAVARAHVIFRTSCWKSIL